MLLCIERHGIVLTCVLLVFFMQPIKFLICGVVVTVDDVDAKAWGPYRICRICLVSRTKKIHRTDITLWKPPVQMLNTKETTDKTCCTRSNEFYLSYEFFSYDGRDRYNHMETRLKRRCYKSRFLTMLR